MCAERMFERQRESRTRSIQARKKRRTNHKNGTVVVKWRMGMASDVSG
jgi:hypothetical protein